MTYVKIKLDNRFVQERGHNSRHGTRFHISDGSDANSVFQVNYPNRFSGTEIIAASGRRFADYGGRWTVYGRNHNEPDHDQKIWFIAPTRKNILVNKNSNNGVRWESDSGTVVRQKRADSNCQRVEFIPVDPQEVTVETLVDYDTIAENESDEPFETALQESHTSFTSRSIFRKHFNSVRWGVDLSVEGSTSTPTSSASAALDSTIHQTQEWETQETIVEEREYKWSITTFTLPARTGRYFRKTEYIYRLKGTDTVILRAIDEVAEIQRPINQDAAASEEVLYSKTWRVE